jgi:Zn-finger nucleic acid-binding protein
MTGRCPKCAKSMAAWAPGAVELDHCPECRGLWFDTNELVQHLADISGETVDARAEGGAETSYACPKCPDRKLHEAYLLDVRVESCPGCDGIFLDLGELHELLGALSAPERSATDSALAGFDHFALGLFVGMRRAREE